MGVFRFGIPCTCCGGCCGGACVAVTFDGVTSDIMAHLEGVTVQSPLFGSSTVYDIWHSGWRAHPNGYGVYDIQVVCAKFDINNTPLSPPTYTVWYIFIPYTTGGGYSQVHWHTEPTLATGCGPLVWEATGLYDGVPTGVLADSATVTMTNGTCYEATYDCVDEVCVEAEGESGEFPTLDDCLAAPCDPPPAWDCVTVEGVSGCEQVEGGAYATEADCFTGGCGEGYWTCTGGYPNTCAFDPDATSGFANWTECVNNCDQWYCCGETDLPEYGCYQGGCGEYPQNGVGHATLEDCENNCTGHGWDCLGSACAFVGGGFYTSQAACEAEC